MLLQDTALTRRGERLHALSVLECFDQSTIRFHRESCLVLAESRHL